MVSKRRGILVLVSCCINMIWIGTSIFSLPGVMAPYWQKSLNITAGTVSKCPFWILLATGIFMYIVGRLQEIWSPRVLIFIGSIILGLTNFCLYYIKSIYYVFAWAFFVGCASAFLYIPAITVVQRWFLKNKGLVVGLVNLVFGISASILAPFINELFLKLDLFKFSLSIGLMSFFTGAILSPFISFPDDLAKIEKREESLDFSLKEVLKSKNFWFIWLCWAFTGGAGISMVTLATLFGTSLGLKTSKAVVILSSFNFANGAGRLFTGIASDKFGRVKTMFICFLIGALGYLFIPITSSFYVWCFCAIAVGIAFGSLFAVSAPLIMECFGIKRFGAVFGLVFTGYGFVAGPLGPWTSGVLLNLTNNFSLVFLYLGILLLFSSFTITQVDVPVKNYSYPHNRG